MSEPILHTRLKTLKHGLENGCKSANLKKFITDIDEVIDQLFGENVEEETQNETSETTDEE